MKLCVIGAGGAGLCGAYHGLRFGYEVTVFEQTSEIGGTWVYNDKTGKDEYGLDIHSSMYQGLHTNLPKEIMGYPSIPFEDQELSYILAEDVLKYYQSFADKFDLRRHIKFEHHVIRVRPLQDESWEVIVQDLRTNNYQTNTFDAVLVCNGHYSVPNVPSIKGQSVFTGNQFHSHDYKSAERFRDESVLIIGAGPSGSDFVQDTSRVAKRVTWSHHLSCQPPKRYGDNVDQKPDVKEIKVNGVEFVDGSFQDFTVIIYCTGYKYTFPFLSVDCEIKCDDNYIRPLYKHCLSINKPTLALIGLPNYIVPNQIFDLQIRFCLTFMSGRKALPSKQDMLNDFKIDMDKRRQRGVPKHHAHLMGPGVFDEYLVDLAATAGIDPIKRVVCNIFKKGLCNLLHSADDFRNDVFKIIDDENFVVLNTNRVAIESEAQLEV